MKVCRRGLHIFPDVEIRCLECKKLIHMRDPSKQHRRTRKYRLEHPEKHSAKEAERRASKLRRTPEWLTKHDLIFMRLIYGVAQSWSKEFEEPFCVDHIIPLKGKHVSGLHVPWNLQVITSKANVKKHNKVEEI